jgi:hypothetical protein
LNGRIGRNWRLACVAAGLSLLFVAVLVVQRRGGVSISTLENRIQAIEEQTGSKIQSSSSRALDNSELPLSIRLNNWTRSLLASRNRSSMGSSDRTLTYLVCSNQKFLEVSVLVVNEKACFVIIRAPDGSAELAQRWRTVLNRMFPCLYIAGANAVREDNKGGQIWETPLHPTTNE